jgi:uncharacterized protein (TIGR02996 family)
MSVHPDVDAFLRVILHNLDDATPRLVFADWLEETDEPSNVAWAQYIRAQAELAAQPPIGGRWGELEAQAAEEVPRIEATLKVPAELLVEQTRALLRLLPIDRFTVDIAGYEPPRAVVELVPESVARENLLVPLAHKCRRILIADAGPTTGDLLDKLEFILNRRVILVVAESEDVRAALARVYG